MLKVAPVKVVGVDGVSSRWDYWDPAKKTLLNDPRFLKMLLTFKKDKLSDAVVEKLQVRGRMRGGQGTCIALHYARTESTHVPHAVTGFSLAALWLCAELTCGRSEGCGAHRPCPAADASPANSSRRRFFFCSLSIPNLPCPFVFL